MIVVYRFLQGCDDQCPNIQSTSSLSFGLVNDDCAVYIVLLQGRLDQVSKHPSHLESLIWALDFSKRETKAVAKVQGSDRERWSAGW